MYDLRQGRRTDEFEERVVEDGVDAAVVRGVRQCRHVVVLADHDRQ